MKPRDASKIVSEQTVEAAWKKIGGLSNDEARRHIQRIFRKQPALGSFVNAFSEDLSDSAAELAVFILVVIIEVFGAQFGKRLQNVGPKRIESIHADNLDMLERLIGADEQWVARAAVVESEEQPYVWKYVPQCLFEREDPEISLSEEDQGSLALIMKTVIDALDSSIR
jgi:hypothetical protein